jgi:hypothetical protein
VDHAHKSDPYDPNSHHRRISFIFKGLRLCTFFLVRLLLPVFHHFYRIPGAFPGAFEARI